jgi:hypothetical protein
MAVQVVVVVSPVTEKDVGLHDTVVAVVALSTVRLKVPKLPAL